MSRVRRDLMQIISLFFILWVALITLGHADTVHMDVLPSTNSTDDTAVLNEDLRRQANAINTVQANFNPDGTFNSSSLTGLVKTKNGGTGQDFSAVPANNLPYFSSIGTMGNIGIGTTGDFLAYGNPPHWLTPTQSNVIFAWVGVDASSNDANFGHGFYTGTDAATGIANVENSYFLGRADNSSYTLLMPAFKWKKVAGVSTLTCYLKIWNDTAINSGTRVRLNINALALSGSVDINSITPTWQSPFTVDVSSLTNGTTYDILVETTSLDSNKMNSYLSGIVILSS